MSNFLTRALIESDGGNYLIERSLRFSYASANYMTKSFSSAPTSTKIGTISFWVKRGFLDTPDGSAETWLLYTGTGNRFGLYIPDNTSRMSLEYTSSPVYHTTTQVFRDPSAWQHIVIAWDTTQATAADRLKWYINGIQITSFAASAYPALNADLDWHKNGVTHTIGAIGGGSRNFDGYIAEFNSVDGQQLTASPFAETNPTTGQWVAKKYTGTYGTNGFYLDFKDGTSTTTLGYDKSGNNNHWTLTNFTRSAGVNDCWMLDVPAGNGSASAVQPSGNYCVWNPLALGVGTLSKGNLSIQANTPADRCSRGTIAVSSGKWFWEATITQLNNLTLIGLLSISSTASGGLQSTGNGVFYVNDGSKQLNSGSLTAYGATYTTNDVVRVELDLDNLTVTFFKNNVSQGSVAINADTYLPAYIPNGNTSSVTDFNFGQRVSAHTPTAGFKALCTANLPTPSIKKPSEHFQAILATGANIKTSAEALFTNELEWIKDRANVNNHQIIDSVRGSSAVLQSNTTAAETTYTAPSGSSVSWVWRASDSAAVSNTNGSITSQVSANVTAGLSVVTYTGTGANATVGHGLGAEPEVVITKRRNSTGNWQMYHKKLNVGTNPQNYRISLNSNGPFALDSTAWNNTAPNSSTFSLGTNVDGNANAGTYVACCFKEIPGYSKFGTYVPNGSADGPFEYTGFKPGFLMVKYPTAGTASWVMYDSIRNTGNPAELDLLAESTAAEATLTGVDFLSNGFKLRGTSANINTSGGTQLIYMAFAESPFNYANAR